MSLTDHSTHYGKWDEFAGSCPDCITPFKPRYFVGVSVHGCEGITQLAFRLIEDPHGWCTYLWKENGEDKSSGQLMCYMEEWFRPLTEEEVAGLQKRWPEQQLLFYDNRSFPLSPVS